MNKDKRPDDIASEAGAASERGDHREAEKLFLTAAARASAYSNQPTMQKNVAKWDKAATRERRLAELTKDSGGGSSATPTAKPLPDWASGSNGLVFAGLPAKPVLRMSKDNRDSLAKHMAEHFKGGKDRPVTVEIGAAMLLLITEHAAMVEHIDRIHTNPWLFLNRSIDAVELHRLFTGDVPNGRAWYDERDKESWVRLATKLQTMAQHEMQHQMKYSEPHTVSDRPFTVENAYADISSILANVERMLGRAASREIVNALHRERE